MRLVLGLWKEAGKDPVAVGMNCSCQGEEQWLGDAGGKTSKSEEGSHFSPPPSATFSTGRMDQEAA